MEVVIGLSASPFWADLYNKKAFRWKMVDRVAISKTQCEFTDGTWEDVRKEDIILLTNAWGDVLNSNVSVGGVFRFQVMSIVPFGLFTAKGVFSSGIYDDRLAMFGNEGRHALMADTDIRDRDKLVSEVRKRMLSATAGSIVHVWTARWLFMNAREKKYDFTLIFGCTTAPHFAAMNLAAYVTDVIGFTNHEPSKMSELCIHGFNFKVVGRRNTKRSVMLTDATMDPLRQLSMYDTLIVDMVKACNVLVVFKGDTKSRRSQKLLTSAALTAVHENADGSVRIIPGVPSELIKPNDITKATKSDGVIASVGESNLFGVVCISPNANTMFASSQIQKVCDVVKGPKRIYIDGDDSDDKKHNQRISLILHVAIVNAF